jgi:4-diphosphocytidyl-2-C-methyl-D-erythritol kinase
MAGVTVRVPAKVNLQLSVGPRRPDGYHDLANVFQAISLHDEVTACPADELSLVVEGVGSATDVSGVPTGRDNLAVRAAVALAARAGVEPTVALRIRKAIPVAGGMAGGSADAAGALVACDALWGTALSRAELDELAAGLGADVPFALLGNTALGVARGDRLSEVLGRGLFHWVLAVDPEGLSTAAVYAECDRLRNGAPVPDPVADPALMSALRAGDAEALGKALSNDLQPAALSLRPSLARTLAAGQELGVLGAVVSGSGPTCAFLVADAEAALDVAVGLSALGVCRDVRRATGPVPGARVISG